MDFNKTGFGWLTPMNKVVGVRYYRHVGEIMDHAEVPFKHWVEQQREELDDIRKMSEGLIAQDEHPEWHCYEMAESDFMGQAYTKLLDAGFIRLGVNQQHICAEGNPVFLQAKMQKLKSLVNDYNETTQNDLHLKVEPRNV